MKLSLLGTAGCLDARERSCLVGIRCTANAFINKNAQAC